MKAVVLLGFLLSSLVFGQNPANPKHLRLIPLGQLPDWHEYFEDGKRVQPPLPPGSVPPADVALQDGKKDGVQTTPLSLGAMSKTLRLDARIPSLEFHEGKNVAGQPWLKAPVHKSKTSLGVIFRDPVAMNWLKPRILLLDDGQKAFPPGNIRFVNVGAQTALVKFGKGSKAIKSGSSLMLPLPVGKNVLTIGYLDTTTGKPVMINPGLVVRMMEGQRVQAFFYQNANKVAEKDLLFRWLPEPSPAL